uniref:Uncharacterized protein n=1 Tax=Rhizobium leguminosarum TaxID=384 RepID=A0A154IRV8_RHILE|nr:hypothetical protein A4A59_35595 [Rhizobium leguminosarum]
MGGSARYRFGLKLIGLSISGQLGAQLILLPRLVIHGVAVGHAKAVRNNRRIDRHADRQEHGIIGMVDAAAKDRHRRQDSQSPKNSHRHAFLRLKRLKDHQTCGYIRKVARN